MLNRQAVPDVVEEWKWRGVHVWYRDGMICTGERYKTAVKMTFAKGASLDDTANLFNASLDGNPRRAIDFHEGDKIDDKALIARIRAAAQGGGESAGAIGRCQAAAADDPVQGWIARSTG